MTDKKSGGAKPSDRIKELMVANGELGGLWGNYVQYIIQYLDEQYEIHKEDIQITQGR